MALLSPGIIALLLSSEVLTLFCSPLGQVSAGDKGLRRVYSQLAQSCAHVMCTSLSSASLRSSCDQQIRHMCIMLGGVSVYHSASAMCTDTHIDLLYTFHIACMYIYHVYYPVMYK